MTSNKSFGRWVGSLLAMGLLSITLVAQTPAASRYDNQIQTLVTHKLATKSQFGDVKASVEDGIVTLAGTVDLYQRKLDAAKLARKTANVQGVRNLITVAGPNVPDAQLAEKLATKLRYVREGYDSTFDYFALGVKDGVVTVEGQDRTGVGRQGCGRQYLDRAGFNIRRRIAAACVAGDLSRSSVEQVRPGSGTADPNHRRERSRDALRFGRQHVGQAGCRNKGQPAVRRLQRGQQAAGRIEVEPAGDVS
jgi:predicted amino acid-binding ACT domain protein